MKTKKCTKCKEDRSLDSFYAKPGQDGLDTQCKACRKAYRRSYNRRPGIAKAQAEYQSRYRQDHLESLKEASRVRGREWWARTSKTVDGTILRLLNQSRSRAKTKGLEYDLTAEWLRVLWTRQDGRCGLTGRPFDIVSPRNGQRNPLAPSLDRVNPLGGYTQANTELVCLDINLAFAEFGREAFDALVKAYLENK